MATTPSADIDKQEDPVREADGKTSGILHDPSQPAHGGAPAVRFSSAVNVISPPQLTAANLTAASKNAEKDENAECSPAQLRALSKSLQGCHLLQERRMNNFAFEPFFSNPASRVPSHEEDSREPSREHTRSSAGRNSPLLSPGRADLNTPPLTPAGTDNTEEDAKHAEHAAAHERPGSQPTIITPQDSTQDSSASLPSPRRLAARSESAEDVPRRPSSSDDKSPSALGDHRKGLFGIGPGGSVPVSREQSPSRASASQFYTRPFTPQGDANDPYAASKRQPQHKIEQRFVFSRKKKASPSSSSVSLPRTSTDKRQSVYSPKKDLIADDDAAHAKTGSMADLKRFFKVGGHHKVKRVASPAPSVKSGYKTPPSSRSSVQIPFGDDHGLTSKYGKLGKVLGAGAGGSVRLMKRSEDGVVFAVKEFRPRHSYETEREYVKKLTAEYCIGSSLHHGNIIETLDIVQEKGKWYEVMEYAPYDLFAIVMTGKMSREEVSCCFLQILSGVTYLHSMGLAHRDLKLDNVVVSEHGIMKIIDFGSAHVFKYPFESDTVPASGIVGSDPYLAPEVYDERKYDPPAVDVWSLAIIYCCMTLRRFPWKIPRLTDSSFKLFAAEPTPGHDPKKLILPPSKSTSALHDTPARDWMTQDSENDGEKNDDKEQQEHKEHHEHKHRSHKDDAKSETAVPAPTDTSTAQKEAPKEVIRGPWRILRLLPRESRHVVSRMLEIDPKKRAKMEEILEDDWIANAVICRQEAGIVIPATDHTHVLEPPSSQAK